MTVASQRHRRPAVDRARTLDPSTSDHRRPRRSPPWRRSSLGLASNLSTTGSSRRGKLAALSGRHEAADHRGAQERQTPSIRDPATGCLDHGVTGQRSVIAPLATSQTPMRPAPISAAVRPLRPIHATHSRTPTTNVTFGSPWPSIRSGNESVGLPACSLALSFASFFSRPLS